MYISFKQKTTSNSSFLILCSLSLSHPLSLAHIPSLISHTHSHIHSLSHFPCLMFLNVAQQSSAGGVLRTKLSNELVTKISDKLKKADSLAFEELFGCINDFIIYLCIFEGNKAKWEEQIFHNASLVWSDWKNWDLSCWCRTLTTQTEKCIRLSKLK